MIVLPGKSVEKNKEMRDIIKMTGIPDLYVDFYNEFSGDAVTLPGYYLSERKDPEEKPFFWLDLQAPAGWSFISESIRQGALYEKGVLQAKIYFREPYEDQCICRIDWIREREIYASDYYNEFGSRYMRVILADGTPKLRTYYDEKGLSTISIWEDEDAVSLRKHGNERFFGSYELFCREFMRDISAGRDDRIVCFYEPDLIRYVPEDCSCVFFQMGKECDCLSDPAFVSKLSVIVVNAPEASEKIRAFREVMNMDKYPPVLMIGQIVKDVPGGSARDALIVTRSQYIEQLQRLAEGLPEIHFHIAARTVMAPGLMEFDRYENVSLYPNSSPEMLRGLLEKCAIYLDINHYLEYEEIVLTAEKADRLVYAFDNTVHRRTIVAEECIFKPEEADRMIIEIKRASEDPEWFGMRIDSQRRKIAVTECQMKELTAEIYSL